MDDYVNRYGTQFVRLKDSRVTGNEFEFDRVLLMPTARGYRALVEQARMEINPRIMRYLRKRWSEGTIENLSSFAMAAAVYARSVSDPPYNIDIGRVLLRTAAICNLRCASRSATGGGCRISMDRDAHHLPRCIKLPRDIRIIWGHVRRYIATGCVRSAGDGLSGDELKRMQAAMRVNTSLAHDFSPAASC